MIKKFIKINGTGRFLNYSPATVPSPHRATDFEKINLIYGENGSGKTTLSVILNSLRGADGILTKKRSFDRTVPQIVEVLTDLTPNPKLTFNNSSWDNNYPNIEIFDIHFITDNVYTGLEVQNSHKKNLFEIIFGSQGVQLKIDIQNIKDGITAAKSSLQNTTSQIDSAIGRAFTATEYCNLVADPGIDGKITGKQAEITTAKSFQEIQSKISLSNIPMLALPFDMDAAVLTIEKAIDSISAEFLEELNKHKEHLGMDGEEELWIKRGYEAIKDETCPFCTRPFDETSQIIEAYNQYFNTEYNELLQKISLIVTESSIYNIEALLLAVENNISANQNLIEFWKVHLNNQPILTSLSQDYQDLKIEFEKVKTLIDSKSKNPIQALPILELRAFETLTTALNQKLSDFNTAITAYNSRITGMKEGNIPNLVQLENELKKLKAIKKRNDATVAALCTALATQSAAVDTLNTQKTTKQGQLDTYSTATFTNYATIINRYLQIFAPYLEIRDFDSGYVGSSREPMVKYALHINGHEIKQEDSPTHRSIRYSLSEGDKNALALSFFLTKLESDGNIQDKIIVFDDPVSSFDLNRKSATINKLVEFGQQAKQLFVFSHNLIFASEFWKSANQVSCTTQCSSIAFIGNSSCIVEYDIDTESLSSVLKDSLHIKDYITNGCVTDQDRRSIARCLRPALESYFHIKFFDHVAPNDWLGNFIDKVRSAAGTADPFYRLQSHVSELTDINNYSKKYHHRFNTNNESEPVSDSELRSYCQRTLNLIQVI
jgi:wobble nucleotide-excising tRNase